MSSRVAAARAAASATTPWWSFELATGRAARGLRTVPNALLARQLHDFFDSRGPASLRNRDAIDRPLSFQRFFNGVYARQFVHEVESLQLPVHSESHAIFLRWGR